MTTAIHNFAPEEIMAHHDGELPTDRAQQVSEHLNACDKCRSLADSFDTTSQSLANWGVDPPQSLQPQAINSLSQFGAVDATIPLFSWQSLRNRRVILALGALVSTISFVYFEIHNTRRQPITEALRGATRVDISDYKPRHGAAAGGGGGGGDREGVTVDNATVSREVARSAAPALTTRNTPGIAADSNGVFHSLGDHASNSFSIDGQPTTQAPMIARTADLQIVATNLDSARAGLETILSRHHGYAANLNASNAQSTAHTLNASLRIPSLELTAALAELKSLGHVINESQAGEEVTAQHADLVARLKNSRETEIRLQDILRNRTGKVSDVLEVEQEIARVRGAIEQMESELKGLDHRVDFATVNLTITEEYKAKVGDTTPGVATRFHNAAVAGLTNVTDSAIGLILWFTEFLPPMIFWLAILATPIAVFWRLRRRAIAAVSASPLV